MKLSERYKEELLKIDPRGDTHATEIRLLLKFMDELEEKLNKQSKLFGFSESDGHYKESK